MVFGPRAVEAIERGQVGPAASGAMRAVLGGDTDGGPVGPGTIGGVLLARPGPLPVGAPPAGDWRGLRTTLQKAMSALAGVVRDDAGLAAAAIVVADVGSAVTGARALGPLTVEGHEVANLVDVGLALIRAATTRTESRGAHTRRDHPATDPTQRHRLVLA